jgi:antirestriction factor ArdC-like protein
MEASLNLSAHHSHSKATRHSTEARQEALTRAISGQSLSNFPAIFQGFAAKGIPEAEIKPRENVFTFDAWKALGRYVRKGEHGVKVVTFIETLSKETDPDTGERKLIRRPWTTTVFHVSQTEPLKGVR